MQKKVMLVDNYSDGSSYWRVACDCCDSDHDAVLWFEYDKEIDMMSLRLSSEVGYYDNGNFLKNFVKRVKIAARILFLGHYRETGEVILNKDGIDGMVYALTEGKKLLEDAK